MAISTNTNLQNIVESTPLNSDLSVNSCTEVFYTRNTLNGKHHRVLESGKQQENDKVLGNQSLKKYPQKQPHRSCDGHTVDGRYLSLGPQIMPVGVMETKEKLTSTELESAKPSSHKHLNLESSKSHGSTSPIQKMSDEYGVSKDGAFKQATDEKSSKLGADKDKLGLLSYLQIFMDLKNQENGDNHDFEVAEEMNGVTGIASNYQAKVSTIDIRNFHSHNPDKMCSAAAFHFTLDLIKTISIKYQNDKASWEVARQIWTTETLLPFVYFILTCNPNLRLWKRIKVLTAAILKNYHSWSIEENTISNQEKLANFILWQTEVTYHILKMSPNVRSSQESEMKSTSEIMVQKLSTLARIFYVIHTDDALEAFMASPTSCRRILKRHVSETFEGDYKLGYPTSGSNQDQHGSVWERWKTKSAEITRIAQDVQWPSFQNPVQSGSEPVLFMNGEIENEIVINKDPQVSQFIQKWESEFMHTMRLVKPWQSKNLIFTSITLKDISHGIHRFSKDWFPKRRKIYDLSGKCKYEVTLLSIFLQQDSQDKMFSDFWRYFAVVESQRTTDSKKRKKLFV